MRFMRLEDVAEELNVNMPQVRSLVRSGDLPAIKVGGRGVWRVERAELEAYIQRQYSAARESRGSVDRESSGTLGQEAVEQDH
jgi:prophage regulatory protein